MLSRGGSRMGATRFPGFFFRQGWCIGCAFISVPEVAKVTSAYDDPFRSQFREVLWLKVPCAKWNTFAYVEKQILTGSCSPKRIHLLIYHVLATHLLRFSNSSVNLLYT